jgi:hypothetical protein
MVERPSLDWKRRTGRFVSRVADVDRRLLPPFTRLFGIELTPVPAPRPLNPRVFSGRYILPVSRMERAMSDKGGGDQGALRHTHRTGNATW